MNRAFSHVALMSAALASGGLFGCATGSDGAGGGFGGSGGVAASTTGSVGGSSGSTTSAASSTSEVSSTGMASSTGVASSTGSGGAGGMGGGTTGSGGAVGVGTCADPVDITDAIAQTGKYDGIADQDESTLTSCGATGAKSRTLQWNVPVAGNYLFKVQGTHAGHEDDYSIVQILGDCQKNNSEFRCATYHDDVRFGVPGPATLQIIISGGWYDTGFTLTIVKEAECVTADECHAGVLGALCVNGACVDCDSLSSCGGMLCDIPLGHCVGCLSNAECVGKPEGSYCGGVCYGCLVDAECAASADGPLCLSSHYCGCSTASDCSGADQQCLAAHCATCLPGSIDCNGSYSDGCEIDAQINPSHCGSCNGCNFGGCNDGVCTAAPVVLRSGNVGVFAMDATTVFLADGAAIYAQPKVGGAATVLVPSAGGSVSQVLVDATHVYYVAFDSDDGMVWRVAKGGGAPQKLYSIMSSFSSLLDSVQIDATDLYVMFDLQMQKKLVRLPKAGGPSTLVLVDDIFLQDEFVLAGDSIYYNYLASVYRLPKAGGSSQYLFEGFPRTDGAYLYTNENAGVARYDLDGTNKLALGALPAGWSNARLSGADVTHAYFSGTSPESAWISGMGYSNAFVFAAPEAGGTVAMVASGQKQIDCVDGDATWTFYSSAGKLLRVTK